MAKSLSFPRHAVRPRTEAHGLNSLPIAARSAVSASIGARERAYAVRREPGGRPAVANVAQGVRATFGTAGATVAVGRHRLSLALSGAGPAEPGFRRNRVSYRYRGVTQWFANGPAGLEQGFTVRRRGPGSLLSLTLRTGGDLTPVQAGRDTVRFRGAPALRYGGLIATDRTGRHLPASLKVVRHRLQIRVDTRGARYPLTVDPTIAQISPSAQLTGQNSQSLGDSVAISGSTIVVGDTGANAAYVFTEPAGGWQTTAQEAAVLTPNDLGDAGDFGTSVAIDGSTIVVGDDEYGPNPNADSEYSGAAYVFTEPAGGWKDASETAMLTSPNSSAYGKFGESVAVSGSTIVVGAPATGQNGSAYAFTQPPSGAWQSTNGGTSLPVGSDSGGNDDFGTSVAISGSTIVVGADQGGTDGNGRAFVYAAPATLLATLTSAGSADSADNGFEEFGAAVAVDGPTIAVGAPGAYENPDYSASKGAAYIFQSPASGSSGLGRELHPTQKLSVSGASYGDLLGSSVSVHGSTVVVGAPGAGTGADNSSQGAAYQFDASSGSGQPTGQLALGDSGSSDSFGTGVGAGTSGIVVGAGQFQPSGEAYVYDQVLSVGKTGGGTGTVTSTAPDGQIDCGPSCGGGYLQGSQVSLTGRADPGSVFTGWGGACAGTPATSSCTVTMSQAEAVTASFEVVGGLQAKVNSPASGGTYAVGQNVPTSFTCTAGPLSPPIVSCTDSNGAAASGPDWTGTGRLNTSAPGSFTYSATATGADGQASPSPPITYRVAGPPVNEVPPGISGTAEVGGTLSCSQGQWAGSVATYTYLWERNGTPIAGATNPTYTLTSADAGTTVQCVVTAANIAGSAAADSAGVAVAASGAHGSLALSSGSVLSNNRIRFTCSMPGHEVRTCHVKLIAGGRAVGSGSARGLRGRLNVDVKLTSYGLGLLVRNTAGVKVRVEAKATVPAVGTRTASRATVLEMGRQLLIPARGMFEPNSPNLTRYGASFLTYVGRRISSAARVICVGYTAAPGGSLRNDAFSLWLSRQRAKVGCRYLRRLHVSARYETEGLGKRNPLAPNTTPQNLARNRRVEFQVTSGLRISR